MTVIIGLVALIWGASSIVRMMHIESNATMAIDLIYSGIWMISAIVSFGVLSLAIIMEVARDKILSELRNQPRLKMPERDDRIEERDAKIDALTKEIETLRDRKFGNSLKDIKPL